MNTECRKKVFEEIKISIRSGACTCRHDGDQADNDEETRGDGKPDSDLWSGLKINITYDIMKYAVFFLAPAIISAAYLVFAAIQTDGRPMQKPAQRPDMPAIEGGGAERPMPIAFNPHQASGLASGARSDMLKRQVPPLSHPAFR